MNAKHIKTIVVGSLCISIMLVAALTNTSLSYAATVSPFVGQWFAIDDFDGSDIRVTIVGKNNGPFTITWTESYFSGCGGEAGIVRGKGSIIESDVMMANLTLVCFKSNITKPFDIRWIYDRGTDTLTSDFTTWHRAKGVSKPCITPPSGVSGWWPADGSANDLVFGRNGDFIGDATTTSGLVDLSFRLDGEGDFISVPNDPGINFGPGDFTIDLWVNFTDASGEQVLIEKWIQGNDALTTSGWTLTKLNLEANQQFLRLAMANGQGAEANLNSGDLDIRPGIWYHFAATRLDHTVILYMNGEPVASQEMEVLNLNSTSSLKFGHRGNPEDTPGSTDDRGYYLNGRIDEVEIFNGTALSAEQIQAIYTAGSAGKCKDAIITPQKPNLRVNYGHDWVESFYEAGHTVKIIVTEADGNTVKATAELITEPKDFWGGEPGFQTRPEDWVPGPPDIQPYDWVFGWFDNGASAQVQLGEINGSVDIEKDEVTGNINAPWILPEEVNMECHPWGSPEPQEMKYVWVLPDDQDVYTCSWEGEWDIQPGQVVGVSYFDPYGNWVVNALLPPWIRAHPEWDNVDGWFWPENKTITLTVDDPATTEQTPDIFMEMPGTVEPNGSLWFDLTDYDLKAGDVITMLDGAITKSLIVSNLTIDTIDQHSDIVGGFADPGDRVRLPFPIPDGLTVFANEYGDWVADFASVGFDVQQETSMIAEEYENDGDLTSYEVWISKGSIVASEAGDWFWMVGFNPGTLYLNIYDTVDTSLDPLWSGQAMADESGFSFVGFDQHGLDLVPGNYVVVSDGVNTKGLVLQSIWMTYFDTRNEIMAGFAPVGSLVWAAAGPSEWQQRIMIRSDYVSGGWEVDFKTIDFDITEEMRGSSYAHIYDQDGDANEGSTPSPLQKPYFTIFPEWEWYDGLNWPDGALVTITIINKENPCTATQESGGGFFNGGFPEGCDVVIGDTVRMTDGTTTQEHTIRNLAINVVDEAQDTVSGMADINSRVYVWPHATGQQLAVTAYDGAWQGDFSEDFDLASNECGRAQIYDSEGNGTAIDWCVPFTLINIFPVGNYVEIHDWRQGVTATASIVGKVGCTGTTVPIYPDWEPQYRNPMQIYFPEGCDIVADDVVTVDNGITYREHIVQNLSVIAVDESADTVSGTADPGANVLVWPHGFSEPPLQPTVGTDGIWIADFSALIDLQGGMCGRSAIFDEAGNSTSVDWCVPNPYFDVRANVDEITTVDWPLGELTVNIYASGIEVDPPDFSITGTVTGPQGGDRRNFLGFYLKGIYDIQPGHLITVSDGSTIKKTTVTPLAFDVMDKDTDTVIGYANPNTNVEIWACGESGCYPRHIITNGEGRWIADWSEWGPQEDEHNTLDLVEGTWVDSRQSDEDNDSTMYGQDIPFSPIPYFDVRPNDNSIGTWNWPLGELMLKIYISGVEQGDPDYTSTGIVEGSPPGDPRNFLNFALNGIFDVQPGYLVTVRSGTIIKRTIVTYLAFESSDADADTVSGFAASGSTVHVWACGNLGCYTRHVIAGKDGSWIADWSVPGSQEDEQNTLDLVNGTWVDSLQSDEDGDNTMYGQTIPVSPHFTIFPEWEWYDGLNWPDVAQVTISIIGKGDSCTATRESWGGFFNGGFPEGCDVVIGDTVRMTDGTTKRTHKVQNLAISGVDVSTNIVSGSADAGAVVFVWPHATGQALQAITGPDGTWQADFSDMYDLQPGECGRSQIYDEGGNATAVDWCVPMPYFTIFPETGRFEGFNWPDGVTVTITVGGKEEWCTSTVESWGGYFNGRFPEGCGELYASNQVRMTDGTTTLVHTVRNLSISEWNTNADTLTGWAYRDAPVVVWPHGYDYAVVTPIAGSDGSWTADFTTIPFDLDYGIGGRAMIYDIDGNATAVDWQISLPTMQIWMEWNTVGGMGWNRGEQVTLTVGEVQLTQTTDGTRVFFYVGEAGHDIVPGDLIQMTNGQILKELLVPPLEIMDYDLGANKINGTYDPNLAFEIHVNPSDPYHVTFIDNSWTAYFNELLPLQWGSAMQINSDNDTVYATIRIPNPTFYVVPDEDKIYASEWSPGEMLYVKVNGSDVTYQQVPDLGSPYGPEVMFDLTSVVDLNAGNTINLTDGRSNKELFVALVQVTGYDYETHTISGIAEPGELLIGVNGIDTWITVGQDGNWSVSSSDYDPGEWGSAIIWDSDGDQTRDIFMIPYPPP